MNGGIGSGDYYAAAERVLKAARTLGGREGRALARLALSYVQRGVVLSRAGEGGQGDRQIITATAA